MNKEKDAEKQRCPIVVLRRLLDIIESEVDDVFVFVCFFNDQVFNRRLSAQKLFDYFFYYSYYLASDIKLLRHSCRNL